MVEPAYRDDNQGIWDFGDTGEPSEDDDDVVMQGARLADGEKGPEREEEERTQPQAQEEEKVTLAAPTRHSEAASVTRTW